jgi:hypothetical protein
MPIFPIATENGRAALRASGLPAIWPVGFSEFDPRTIAGLGLWLRGDVAYTSISPDVQATNGESVRRWPDLSGSGRHYDQAVSGNKPLFAMTGLNGLPALSYDGLDDFVAAVAGLDLFRNVSGATNFCVAQATSGTVAATQNLSYVSTATASTTRSTIGRAATNTYSWGGRRLDADTFSSTTAGTTSASPFCIAGLWDYANARLTPYLNGAAQTPIDPFKTAGNTSDTDSATMSVGANGTGSSGFTGRIAEVLVWRRVLTTAERAAVHAYLGRRYGIAMAA